MTSLRVKALCRGFYANVLRREGDVFTLAVPGSWWNIFPGGKPFFDQSKRLLNLTIADIPAADRKQIEAALRARNRLVSDATVRDPYLETQMRSRR